MKKYFVIGLLLSHVCFFAQVKNVLFQPITNTPTLNINFNKNKQPFSFNQLQLYTTHDFSVFNRTTMLNDNFSVYKGQYEYSNSVLIPQNMFFNSKIDSFNPNGVSDFGNALLSGVLSLTMSLFNTK